MRKISQVFKVLSNELSIRVVKLLFAYEEICVCEFGAALEKPSYEISKLLKHLREVGLVSAKRKGKYNFYKLANTDNSFVSNIINGVSDLKDKVFEQDRKRFSRKTCSLK